jgi:hypothetical protein
MKLNTLLILILKWLPGKMLSRLKSQVRVANLHRSFDSRLLLTRLNVKPNSSCNKTGLNGPTINYKMSSKAAQTLWNVGSIKT